MRSGSPRSLWPTAWSWPSSVTRRLQVQHIAPPGNATNCPASGESSAPDCSVPGALPDDGATTCCGSAQSLLAPHAASAVRPAHAAICHVPHLERFHIALARAQTMPVAPASGSAWISSHVPFAWIASHPLA